MSIQIIADSACDIAPQSIQSLDLAILPLSITIGSQHYLDGETIQIDEIYDLMRRGVVPQTAQIPYERTYQLFKSCLEEGRDVIYISFSSMMSGCFALAQIIARELLSEFPEGRIAVLDSKGGSGATGLLVLQALKMAEAGYSFENIRSEIQFMAEHIEHVFSIDELNWLAKGGRIPKIVGTLGSKLGIRPLLEVEKGTIVVKRMIRGRKNAMQAIADRIIQQAANFPSQLIAIAHADDIASAKSLEALIIKGMPDCITTICHIGGVLGIHLGLKGIGAFCLNQRPEHYCLT